MKRERDGGKMIFFFKKNVSTPSNPPDGLAQNVSKKNPFLDELFLHFSAKVQNLAVFFIYLHDSNSIFWARGINSEWVFGRTVMALGHPGELQGQLARRLVLVGFGHGRVLRRPVDGRVKRGHQQAGVQYDSGTCFLLLAT